MVLKIDLSKFKVYALFLFITFPALYAWIKEIIGSASLAHGLLVIICYGFFVASFTIAKDSINAIYIFFLFIILLVFGLYGLINFSDHYLLESYALPSTITFFSGMCGFYFMVCQRDAEDVKKAMKIIAIILTIYYYYYSLDLVGSAEYEFGYSMGYGFHVLFPCLLNANFALEKRERKKWLSFFWWVMFAICMLLIFIYGSRGPIIGVVTFFVFKYGISFMLDKRVSPLKKLIVSIGIAIIFFLLIIYAETFFLMLAKYLEPAGIKSRTITRFLNSSMTYDNGRNDIFKTALSMMGILGNGPFYDQYLWGVGNYCHNFFVEILFDFGAVGGGAILIALFTAVVKIVSRSAGNPWYELFLVYLSYCIGRLMFSGTFWSETNFWILIALGVLCLKRPDIGGNAVHGFN